MNTIEVPHITRSAAPCLAVHRSGIRFHNVATDRVSIEIEVENSGDADAEPTSLRIEAATLGAFVPWHALARLPVPRIPARGKVIVQTSVRQPRPKPVGSLSGLVPPELLTAAGFGPDRRRLESLRRAVRPAPMAGLLFPQLLSTGLPPDLHSLFEGPQPHWAGNLNIWIRQRPVERHMAPRLRIHAGRTNLAAFCVGDAPDQFAFRIQGPGYGWDYALFDMVTGKSVAWSVEEEDHQWHAAPGMSYFFLILRPPQDCEPAAVHVHVTQHSTKRTAVVEFDLDPTAQGPGCYAV